MATVEVWGVAESFTIGTTGLQEIAQNVRVILTTLAGSAPLDRSIAYRGDYIDQPLPAVMRRDMAAMVEAVEEYEPRVKLKSITFRNRPDDAMDGTLYPVATIEIKDGVEL